MGRISTRTKVLAPLLGLPFLSLLSFSYAPSCTRTIDQGPDLTAPSEPTEPVSTATCICEGAIIGGMHPVPLSSPFFRDGLELLADTGHNNSCCLGLQPDTRINVMFSSKYSQYGHFLFNGIAPLWDKVRHLLDKKLVIHFYSADTRRLSLDYLHTYLSMFGEPHVHAAMELNRTRLLLVNPVLGLSSVSLDHYNFNANPGMWQGFRDFLFLGLDVMSPKKRLGEARITLIQRKENRRIIRLDELRVALETSILSVQTEKKIRMKVVDFEDLSPRDQAMAVADTDILIGAEGTGIMNGLFLPANSCIISVLPYGFKDLWPHRGKNFNALFTKLGTLFRQIHSLPVNNHSLELYRLAESYAPTDWNRDFLLRKQDVLVDHDELIRSVRLCLTKI